MSELIQARWHRKLENWALWYAGGESRGVSSAYGASSSAGWKWWEHPPRQATPLVGEAVDTDQLVAIVAHDNPGQFSAIRAWYVWSGTVEQRATDLGIHRDTLRDRIVAARYRLDDLDQQRRRGAIRPPMSVAYA